MLMRSSYRGFLFLHNTTPNIIIDHLRVRHLQLVENSFHLVTLGAVKSRQQLRQPGEPRMRWQTVGKRPERSRQMPLAQVIVG